MRFQLFSDFSRFNGADVFSFQNKSFFLVKELGSGGYGDVKLFESEDGTKRFAVKCERIYNGRYAFGALFDEEAKWYQKIHGLGILSGDPKKQDKPHYVLMPYFDGKPLCQITYFSAKQIFYDWIWTAAAINELHQKHSIIHGDLKTDNVISGTKVYIIDFGFVTRFNQTRNAIFPADERELQYHQAPELFTATREKKTAQLTQDIYSLGIILRDLTFIFFNPSAETSFAKQEHYEKTNEVVSHLCAPIPADRWSIAKSIYILATAFLSTIPRSIWEKIAKETTITLSEDPAALMQSVCAATFNSAIQMRVDELSQEKKWLDKTSGGARVKEKKIIGLRDLQISLAKKPSAALDALYEANQDRDITRGFFRHKTRDLLCDLSEIATCFQQVH